MIRNTPTSWGFVSRNLHWLIAAMITVQVPLGFWMNAVYDELIATKSYDFSQLLLISRVHHTNGFLILILATLRLTWRASNPTPALPPGLAAYQRALARLTHVFLYALLFAFPLSGWATLSAYEGVVDAVKLSPPTHGLTPQQTRDAQRQLIGVVADITGGKRP